MADLINFSRPRDRQPQEVVVPISDKIRPTGLWLASTSRNLVTQSTVSLALAGPGATAIAWRQSGAGTSVSLLADSSSLPARGASVIIKGWRSTAGKRADWGVADSTDLARRFGGHIPYTDGTVYFDFGGLDSGLTRLSVASLTFSAADTWAFSTGARGMEIWQNGRLVASNGSNPTRSQSADPWGLGTHGATSSTADELSAWEAVATFGEQLPQALLYELTRQFYATAFEVSRILVPVNLAAASSTVFNPLSGRGGAAAQPVIHH